MVGTIEHMFDDLDFAASGLPIGELRDDDLVRDMTQVLTSFCARLYGRRSARNRAEKALRCAARDVGPMALVKEPS